MASNIVLLAIFVALYHVDSCSVSKLYNWTLLVVSEAAALMGEVYHRGSVLWLGVVVDIMMCNCDDNSFTTTIVRGDKSFILTSGIYHLTRREKVVAYVLNGVMQIR